MGFSFVVSPTEAGHSLSAKVSKSQEVVARFGLAVSISARPENCVPRVYRNALLEIDGQVRQPPFTLSLPPGTVQKSFAVI